MLYSCSLLFPIICDYPLLTSSATRMHASTLPRGPENSHHRGTVIKGYCMGTHPDDVHSGVLIRTPAYVSTLVGVGLASTRSEHAVPTTREDSRSTNVPSDRLHPVVFPPLNRVDRVGPGSCSIRSDLDTFSECRRSGPFASSLIGRALLTRPVKSSPGTSSLTWPGRRQSER